MMNIYMLLEGKRTERKVYPKWLSTLLPFLSRVDDPYSVENNNYYVFSAEGYPAVIENDLINAIDEVNLIGKYNYLLVCLDADDDNIEEKLEEIYRNLSESNKVLNNCELIPVIQNCCIESWFLGNRRVYTRNPQNNFIEYADFYDVSTDDPELMEKPSNYEGTKAAFHHDYLKAMLTEKHCRYSKSNPGVVCDSTYLEQLIKRTEETNHLPSLKEFIHFCFQLSAKHAVEQP